MCLGKSYKPKDGEEIFELHGFRRCGFYALLQIISMLIGICVLLFGTKLFNIYWLYNLILGGCIIIIFLVLPNGKPFFINLYRMGHEYILFDDNLREIYLISGRYSSIYYSKILISSYSQFRGIAKHYKTNKILILLKRKESLLLKEIGDKLTNKNENIFEEISLFWFAKINIEYENAYFGITFTDFKNGIVDINNIQIKINYDYYKKINKQKYLKQNNILDGNNFKWKKKKKKNQNKLPIDDKEYDAIYLNNKDAARFNSVQGASIEVQSDEDNPIIVDYV